MYIEFCKYVFSRFESLKYCVLKYENPKFVGVQQLQPCIPLKITVFSNLDTRTTFYYAHDKRCVILHWMTALKKKKKKKKKMWRKCESTRFIESKESCLVPCVDERMRNVNGAN